MVSVKQLVADLKQWLTVAHEDATQERSEREFVIYCIAGNWTMTSELRIRWDSTNQVKYSVLEASTISIGQKSHEYLQNYHWETNLDNDRQRSADVPILATVASYKHMLWNLILWEILSDDRFTTKCHVFLRLFSSEMENKNAGKKFSISCHLKNNW